MTDQELKQINGGLLKVVVGKYIIIGGAISFLIGAVNGYLRPLTCSSSR
jgi:lactobin A/cerein 7B family class IIb bacteriocin